MRHYVKVAHNPTFWLVEDGERTPVFSLEEYGILPIKVVTLDELSDIPLAGWSDDEEE